MGFRHRSIRLRVGILVAVPVVFLFTLYSVAAGLSLGSAVAQTRAKSVRAELALPISNFQQQLGLERGLAVLRIATPADQAVTQRFVRQQAATTKSLTRLEAVVKSAAVVSNATSSERGSMRALVRQRASLNLLRSAVSGNTIPMRAAVARYDAIINIGDTALDAICDAQVNVAIVTQSLEILTLDKADQAAVAETDLLAGDMAQAKFPDADRTAIASLAATRQQLIESALPDASRNFRTEFATHLGPAVTGAIVTAESTVHSTPWRNGAPPPKVTAARTGFIAYSGSLGRALASATDSLQQAIDRQASAVQLQLVVAASIGLLALMGTIVLSVIVGNGLLHQLRELRGSALVLAHDKLPHVMAQVRAGQPVDLAEFAPPEVPTRNEIEQVQQAFGIVQQAAVQAAVEEAKLRRGVSDVFRNLAGRSQSLLHRQLTLLDGMERRATEPEELDALFRLDHLTTRMRRHAEGLIILAGDTPARGWRQPVPLIDVLRGAVAEVEDYTRIRVQCRTSAAVAGHAVADIVHLIAELAENATVFSPPNTPVRMQGDSVGRGLAIEIEDRGLGMSQARLEEINTNL
ncbi:MAG: nitrate- and nitrite sensing domain-containing protein, partial [Actinobacteria bacterium]|nr:nitrate- and nitrite sensing domain-containing protein [Actinomycetota bacterium]